MAFQAVRIQQSVVEFILNHREQIFSSEAAQMKPKEGEMVSFGNLNMWGSRQLELTFCAFSSIEFNVRREIRHAAN